MVKRRWELTPLQEIQMKLIKHYAPMIKEFPGGNPIHYMAFDPGEGTGWATFNEIGYPTGWGNVYNDVNGVVDLSDSLSEMFQTNFVPKVVIYEKWKLLKTKEFYGSTMLSCQVVGLIRSLGYRWGAELVSHETTINSVAQKWSGLKPVGAHSKQHWVLAFNHGFYELQMRKKITPRIMWNEPGGM